MKFLKSIYLTKRFYITLAAIFFLFVLGYFFEVIFIIGKIAISVFPVVWLLDILLLYYTPKKAFNANRQLPDRLSNGDKNSISISILNNYSFAINFELIDEIPVQFQVRDFLISGTIQAGEEKNFVYQLRPVKRGVYQFERINIFVSNQLALIKRRFKFDLQKEVAVYPSFIQMRKYELLAISNRLTEAGIKKVRRIANNREFEQIREYVKGDDYRTINWKATARKSQLMVNQYQDERSQHVYSLIDMGRTMKMPFHGMTLLDYSINASLVISNIAMVKHDKAGLITFSNSLGSLLPAKRHKKHMMSIMELLYRQQTAFFESDYEMLYAVIKRKIKQRSLLLLFTNFESLQAMKRQLKFFRQLAKNHLLLVIFFENTEVKKLLNHRPVNIESTYIKTIAEKFAYEKRQIVKELNQHGIHTLLTPPAELSINTINKYLQFKALGFI